MGGKKEGQGGRDNRKVWLCRGTYRPDMLEILTGKIKEGTTQKNKNKTHAFKLAEKTSAF